MIPSRVLARTALTAALAAALVLPAGAEPRPYTSVENDYLTGQLLVASPNMGDPRFIKTVIFMIKHDAHGAMGLVVNQVLGAGPIGDLLKGFGLDGVDAAGDISIHYGGPVQPYLGFVLHSTDYADDATVEVNNRIALTTELEILEAISNGKGPTRSLFALGYAGWGPGQLEGELREDAWYVAPADETIIFDDEMDTKWTRAVALSAIDL